MDIVKDPSQKMRIHFLRNTTHADRFIVRPMYDSDVVDFYLKSHHLPPHENSGYQDLTFEWAFALERPKPNDDAFLNFIRYEKGIKHPDEERRITNWLDQNGWYEFPDLENKDNWIDDFYDFEKQQQLQEKNGNGKQTTLF